MKYRNIITLKFEVKPLPKQSARFAVSAVGGSVVSYQTDVIKQYEKNLLIEALSQRPRGYKKMTGPIFARVSYRFAPEASLKATIKSQIQSGKKVFKMTKPDLTDNLNKPLFDALEGHFYENDHQIVRHSAEKIYATKPSIELTLIEL